MNTIDDSIFGPIGIFDSGVGGLNVWKEIVHILPNETVLYVGDSLNCPYGQKSIHDIIKLTMHHINFLISKQCKLIVIACNTVTAAAIEVLRKQFSIPFIGMEPATKVASQQTKTGVIGILATQETLKGTLFKKTKETYAAHIKVITRIGYGLVEAVEKGEINSEHTQNLLQTYLLPMVEQNADQVVLGCTHYPFLKEQIKLICGETVTIIDTSASVAKRTYAVLQTNKLAIVSPLKRNLQFYISANRELFQMMVSKVYNGPVEFYSL